MPAEKIARGGKKNKIEDRIKRTNLKSKRKRTLIRKAIEVSQLCDLDIMILIQDRDTRKIIEYNSGGIDKQIFTFDDATYCINLAISGLVYHHIYTDLDYEKL